MNPVNLAVFSVCGVIITLSTFIIVQDARKRRKRAAILERDEKTNAYCNRVNATMQNVALMLFAYMARTAMALPIRTGRILDEHEIALLPIQYEYEYKGKSPFAQRTSNTAIFKFRELGITIRRTATTNDVVLSIEVPAQGFGWVCLIGDNTTLLSAINNFERLMQKREVPPDLSELLPKDGAWLCRLAHISTTDYKWLLAEAAKPATKVTEEEVAMYDEHLRLLYVDLRNTLLTN